MKSRQPAHERILQAAFELISGKGYAAVCTREIASRAGVAEVTIFRHFASKENLFRQTAQHYSTIPVLEELIPTILDKPINDGIAILVHSYLDRLNDNKAWIRIFQMELQRDPETFQPLFRSFLDELHRVCGTYFTEIARRGATMCCDPQLAARVFVMLCFGFFQVENMQLGNGCRSLEDKPMIDAMIKMICLGVASSHLDPDKKRIEKGGEQLV